ncbi:ABC transporter ATP-binding protein [Pseudonocardia parietis]|uniref:Multiple sugar transport system ATP-binding protein n=1 Tax=Pseudonocardia parietis TaxID=570936 RepID=A0ABS4W6K2_9PSEU|nr:ABC transporter ATP-binding protein [Pseudonocardia parietis]MBP2371826.1 multiple sugar transport system ATP-binding protein [Pseudonocardia parietis]
MSRIQIEGLTRRFGDVAAVDGISLDVADGEFLVLLGPSGCGKSTLLRMIAGLTAPSGGRILLDDRDITAAAPRERNLAMVFQSYALYPHLTVAKNIGFPLRTRRRKDADAKIAEVAAVLGLEQLLDRRPRALSGGQRQRVALGRALVRDPGAFLLDEPLSNLDATLRTATRGELSDLHRRLGSTFVYVTHDQIEAMTMATRIAVLNGGRLEQVGTPEQVYDAPASTFVAGFIGSPAIGLLAAQLRSADGELRAQGDGIDIPLGVLGDSGGRDVLVGVRPEHLRVGAGDTQLRGTVRHVENLGGEEVAHVEIGAGRVAVRGPRPLCLAVGDHITLTCEPDRVHLFSATSGRRLVRTPDPDRATVAV